MTEPIDEDAVMRGRDLVPMFKIWDEKHLQPGYDPTSILVRIAELCQEETAIYLRKDPDPFDERHPSRADPECLLGKMLKILFKKDNFMTRLTRDYLKDNFFTRQNIPKSSLELNIAASRLILVIMPGLETSAVFQSSGSDFDNLLHRLYAWAESGPDPLQSYATGLLAAAMEVQDIASNFREQNARLIPFLLKKLSSFQHDIGTTKETDAALENTSVAAGRSNDDPWMSHAIPMDLDADDNVESESLADMSHLGGGSAPSSPESKSPQLNGMFKFRNNTNLNLISTHNTSTHKSTDRIYARSMIPIHPSTPPTSQMLILRYLSAVGEYQEFLAHVFEQNAMLIIFWYIENIDPRNTCLAFEAIKYLASLLCHKKFALEFVAHGGLERLLKVPRPSVSATGVSVALYYLAYSEDAMERICAMPSKLVTEIVRYALWLLGCSHESGRCHGTMFFGLAFQFKVILDEFDAQDGLRKLYNVISVLPLLSIEDFSLNDDEEGAARQLVRHVCVALKKYMESHLFYKYTQVMRQQSANEIPPQPIFRSPRSTPETFRDHVRTLQELMTLKAFWPPVDDFLNLGGITLLLRVVAFSYEWNYSGRAESVRNALDVMTICCVIQRVHMVFCERLELPDEQSSAGISIILGAAQGDIVGDAEVQKSALAVLVHCVCAPIYRPQSVGRYGSAKKKAYNKQCEDMIQKVWESVRSNNGIIILLELMQVKTPITDADCIRGMACRALAGLVRSDTVQQILSKLPLFENGDLQNLMRDPILQEKRTEHVNFQKYAFELLDRVSGRKKTSGQTDTSLANIHRANVVAQTKIQFNEQQLFVLIHEHFLARGMSETADALQKEAGLSAAPVPNHQQKLPILHSIYRSPTVSRASRLRKNNGDASNTGGSSAMVIDSAVCPHSSSSKVDTSMSYEDTAFSNTPIKLIKKSHPTPASPAVNSAAHGSAGNLRSLQKQTDAFIVQRPNQTLSETNNYQAKNITLDTIITEYLTNQHALCKNPMSTCPQFDLFVPHKCPDPHPNRIHGMSSNFAARFFKRQSGFCSDQLDRRLMHSQFCVTRTIRQTESDTMFTSCDFLKNGSNIVIGTVSGEVKVYNVNDSTEKFSHECHESYVNSVTSNRDSTLVVTACAWQAPLSVVWNIRNKDFTFVMQLEDEEGCEFSNYGDKLLGTHSDTAVVYDLNTTQKIATYKPAYCNSYNKNKATFSPMDDLILSDGVLWDVRTGREIHKFDKLNQTLSGVFHPSGLEIVSNTEVWDLRTFHLLRTVPALDQCYVKFSSQNAIYGYGLEKDRDEFDSASVFGSSFKTLDSYDYSSITTVDTKRSIHDLVVNPYGSQIATVETLGSSDNAQESAVRIYWVGRKKNNDDEAEEDEEDIEGSDDESLTDADSTDNRRRGRRFDGANGGLRNFASSDDDDDNFFGDDDDNDSWLTTSGSSDNDSLEAWVN